MALREIAAQFDVVVNSEPLKKLDKGIGSVTSKLAALGKALVSETVFGAAKEFISGQLEAAHALQTTSEKLGIAVEDIQRLGYALKISGSEASYAGDAIKFLQKNMQEAKDGSATAQKAFKSVGVGLEDLQGLNTVEILAKLADGFQKLGAGPEATARALEIFGRAGLGMVPLLAKGGESVRKLSEEAENLGIVLEKETVEALAETKQNVERASLSLRGLGNVLTAAIFPKLNVFALRMTNLVVAFRNFVKDTNLAKVASILFGVVAASAFIKAGIEAAKFLGFIEEGAKTMEVLFSVGKLGIWLALITAAVVAFEDLYTWITGGESVFGDFLADVYGMEGANQILYDTRDVFNNISEALDGMGPTFTAIAKNAIPVLGEGLEWIARTLAAIVTSFFHLGEVLGNLAFGDLEGANKALDNWAFDFGKAFDLDTGKLKDPRAASAASAPWQGPENTLKNIQQSNDITINLNGPADEKAARRIGQTVRTNLQDEMQAARAAAGGGG